MDKITYFVRKLVYFETKAKLVSIEPNTAANKTKFIVLGATNTGSKCVYSFKSACYDKVTHLQNALLALFHTSVI